MLHKLIDFTQTILGTVALTGIIALSVITVNALNPTVKNTSSDEAKVAGLSTLPKEVSTLPIQFTNAIKDSDIKGNLTYISDNKSTYRLEVQNLTQIQELEFLNTENLNHYSTNFSISLYSPQSIAEKLKVEILDNINKYEIGQSQTTFVLNSIEQKPLKLKLTPLININFPFELEFVITQ